MQTAGWFIFLLAAGLALTLGLRRAVKRGGRKVEPVNLQALTLSPPYATKRRIFLEGAHNFRDIGGYQTREGQHVIWGKAFRSDELSDLSDQDLVTIGELGLRLMIDLRNPSEIKGQEARLPAGVAYQQMRIYKREPLIEYLPAFLFQRHTLPQALAASYVRLAETRAEVFGAVLRLFADTNNFPLNYHCTSGKDRTGIITALLLALLGVPDETVIADYSLSNLGFEHYYRKFEARGRLNRLGVPFEEFSALFTVDPRWMENLLAHIRTRYGTVTAYLIQKAQLNQDTLARIRENMLE